MITREFLNPADLSGAQTLHIHELADVIMVDEYEDFVFAAF